MNAADYIAAIVQREERLQQKTALTAHLHTGDMWRFNETVNNVQVPMLATHMGNSYLPNGVKVLFDGGVMNQVQIEWRLDNNSVMFNITGLVWPYVPPPPLPNQPAPVILQPKTLTCRIVVP